MSKTFHLWLPEQAWLLPPSPIDWLPKDHLAFFLLDLIDQLDLEIPSSSSTARRTPAARRPTTQG